MQLINDLPQGLREGPSERIGGLLRKWLDRLPHPFDDKDRAAGYRYELSILQAEFALTPVLDHPVSGRVFFEQVIRENLDIGRPDQVQRIFNRRVTRRTPGRFRTRVITEGVTPLVPVILTAHDEKASASPLHRTFRAAENSDLFDVLAHVAYAEVPLTRPNEIGKGCSGFQRYLYVEESRWDLFPSLNSL